MILLPTCRLCRPREGLYSRAAISLFIVVICFLLQTRSYFKSRNWQHIAAQPVTWSTQNVKMAVCHTHKSVWRGVSVYLRTFTHLTIIYAIQNADGYGSLVRDASTHQHYYAVLHTRKQFSARRYKFSKYKLFVNDCNKLSGLIKIYLWIYIPQRMMKSKFRIKL